MPAAIQALYEAARYARARGDHERADRWFAIADAAVDETAETPSRGHSPQE